MTSPSTTAPRPRPRNGSPNMAAPSPRPRRKPPRARTSSSPASAMTTTCARSPSVADGCFPGHGQGRHLCRQHHRLGRSRARTRRKGRGRRLRSPRRAGLRRPGRRRERRADRHGRRRPGGLRQGPAGHRQLCPHGRPDGPGRRRPAHQDDQPDLHRRSRPGPRRGHPFRQEGRPRHRKGRRRHLQGCRRLLADGKPPQDDDRRQIRFRLRRRLDAQGSRHLPRRGRPQRRQPAGHRPGRPVLQGRPGDGRQALGHVVAAGAAGSARAGGWRSGRLGAGSPCRAPCSRAAFRSCT